MLDKNSVVPLYIQLYRILKESIRRGEYKEGDRFPSETTLMKQYQTTRGTVRKAISELVMDGLVYQVQGKGTYVHVRPIQYSMWNFSGFTDYLRSRNEVAVSKVLEQEIVILKGLSYFKLVRARGVKKDGSVHYLTIDTSFVPIDRFPQIDQYDFSQESLYRIMREKYRVHPKYAEIQLSPTIVDDDVRQVLQVTDEAVALLKADGRVLNEKNEEIEKVSVIYSPKMEFKLMTTIT